MPLIYLTTQDFSPVLKDQFLASVIASEANVLETAEMQCMAEVESYLGDLYDMAEIWSKEGNDRHHFLVQSMVNIIRYRLFQRLPKGAFSMPTYIQADAQQALLWLTKLSQGDITSTLPAKKTNGVAKTITKWGSNPKNRW